MGIKKIRRRATKLLNNFGKIEGPYIHYKDECFDIKKYLHNKSLLIECNGQICYDEANDIYLDGEWKRELKRRASNISITLEDEKQKQEKCNNLFKDAISIMTSREIENNNITDAFFAYDVRFYRRADLTNNVRIVIDYYALGECMHSTISLYYLNEEVYRRVSEATGDDEAFGGNVNYPIYISGEWENELFRIRREEKSKRLSLQIRHMTDLCNKIKKN